MNIYERFLPLADRQRLVKDRILRDESPKTSGVHYKMKVE